jgi:hypothetical protein
MTLRHTLTLQFLRSLLATPRGRAHVLNQIAEAESSGEAQVFEQALARVDDPQLARMIEKHQADEVRHAALFRGCIERTGVDPGPVPSHLRVMDRIDRALGGFLARPIADARGVMEAYVLLQVVEERALDQFELLEQGFRAAGDTASADTFALVARDEERHLRYCHAISRRYAPSDAVRRDTLARYRRIEARAFADNSLANMRHTLERGMLPGGLTGAAWRAVAALQEAAWVLPGAAPVTRFAREEADAVARAARAAA